MSDKLLNILRIPEGDIVVTRKVPMTDETCDQLRTIKAEREQVLSEVTDSEVHPSYSTL